MSEVQIVNRGFILVRPKGAFTQWANKFEEEFALPEDFHGEPSVYLIEEDFTETETLLKANFKAIMTNELFAVTENDDEFPEIKLDVFQDWFDVEFGGSVYDNLDQNLIKE